MLTKREARAFEVAGLQAVLPPDEGGDFEIEENHPQLFGKSSKGSPTLGPC